MNGKIVDGTGNPWVNGDIGIVGDTVVEIGDLSDRKASVIIDADGLVISPGFIDMHTHADDGLSRPESSANLNYLLQGVTTVRTGSDGSGSFKIADTKTKWEAHGIGTNAVMIAGFNTIRREVMGRDQLRAATLEELDKMKALVRKCMQEGGWGISTCLKYGGYNIHVTTDEVIEVTKPVGLEQYSYATFIGEPSGINTHFFANSRKNLVLPNS